VVVPTLSPSRLLRQCDHRGVSDKRRDRLLSYSGKNMVYSMLAVLGLAFAWWAIAPNPDGSQRPQVQVAPAAGFAAREVDWPVWSPADLGEGWRTNTVEYADLDGVPTWAMGWTSSETTYVAMRQAVDPSSAWRQEVLGGMQQQDRVVLTGPSGEHEWQVWTGVSDNDENEVALVLPSDTEQPAETIVHGTADIPEMTTFIESLEVVDGE